MAPEQAHALQAPIIQSSTNFTPTGFRWLHLKRLLVQDRQGRSYVWECVERSTRPTGAVSDGVAVFARVASKARGTEEVLLVVQWRAPINQFVLELPAGLLDVGETLEQNAERELLEETGYTGRVVFTSPELVGEPGICNNTLNLAYAEVDGDAAENQHPQPAHELGETIQPLLVPLEGLLNTLADLKQQHGWAIDARLYALALGLQHGAVQAAPRPE